MEKRVLAVGSTQVDIVAQAAPAIHIRKQKNSAGKENFQQGQLNLYLGGCAYVLTLRLLENQIPAYLLTYMADTPFVDSVKTRLKEKEVPHDVLIGNQISLGGYSLHYNAKGKPVSGIFASKPDLPNLTYLQFKHVPWQEIGVIAFDLNMHTNDIANALLLANVNGIPSVATGSWLEQDSQKADILKNVTYLVLKAEYLEAMAVSLGLPYDTEIDAIARQINGTLVVIQEQTLQIINHKTSLISCDLADIPYHVRTSVYFDTILAEMITRCLIFSTPVIEGLYHEIKLLQSSYLDQSYLNGEPLFNTLESLRQQIKLDYLTGLYNRKTVLDLIGSHQDLNSFSEYAVIMLDIDNFKKINDTYGHPEGDLTIKFVADCIQQSMRGGDIAGRWGGEEFLMILPAISKENSQIVANRLRERIKSGSVPRLQSNVTASIGVCHLKGIFNSSSIAIADQALYSAKRTGKDKVVLQEFI